MTDALSCPCGSSREARDCCAPILAGERDAGTAEELMRSRYSAHVRADIEHIVRTTLPEQQAGLDREAIREWATQSNWLGLKVLKAEDGADPDEAFVEFEATFEVGGQRQVHQERSRFERRGGSWFFDVGSVLKSDPSAPAHKPGRNDPCPCGSGRKFKKCCDY